MPVERAGGGRAGRGIGASPVSGPGTMDRNARSVGARVWCGARDGSVGAMSRLARRAPALLLIALGCALVGHLWMLQDVGVRPSAEGGVHQPAHAAGHASAAPVHAPGGHASAAAPSHAKSGGEDHPGHTMIATCVAVLAGVGVPLLALRHRPSRASSSSVPARGIQTRRPRISWHLPPPRPPVDEGVLLRI